MSNKGGSLASKWRQIQGENQWEGILDPPDLDLRKEIVRYGDFIQAMYDAFDNDEDSKYAGSSRYGKSELFEKVGLNDPKYNRQTDYAVTRYFYASATANSAASFFLKSVCKDAWSKETNWNGYIAVADDKGKEWLGRRDIVVVFRGTLRAAEWVDDVLVNQVKLPPLNSGIASATDDGARFASGWVLIYNSTDASEPFGQKSCREQIIQELNRLIQLYKDEDLSITVVGHSLGASLAVLCAYDIANLGINMKTNSSGHTDVIPVTAIAFGCPGVGNSKFKDRAEQLPGLRILRIQSKQDLIPIFPSQLLGYEHVGQVLQFDFSLSPYLKDTKNPSDMHNLQANLHLVAGMQASSSKTFKLEFERDYALVNKSADILKDDLLIPGIWWQLRNKGLELDENGNWRLLERKAEDMPSIDNAEFN